MKIIVFIFIFMLCACDYTVQGTTNSPLPHGLPDCQVEKQKITDECYENRISFNENYRARWKKGSVKRDSDKTVPSSVVWLTIAGCLMETDPSDYESYYSYISSKLNDKNEYVAASAVTAMRAARGEQSIDRIIEMIADKRGVVSGDAVLAIDYLMKSAMYDSSRKQDYIYAANQMKQVCTQHEARNLERTCRENGLIK